MFTGLSVWAIVRRAVAFLALWLILVGGPDPADRPAGIVALVAATWASLRLLPPGPALSAFCALTSLAPGTLPAGTDDDGAIVVHCLDVGQPVASHLAADEELLTRALGHERHDG